MSINITSFIKHIPPENYMLFWTKVDDGPYSVPVNFCLQPHFETLVHLSFQASTHLMRLKILIYGRFYCKLSLSQKGKKLLW